MKKKQIVLACAVILGLMLLLVCSACTNQQSEDAWYTGVEKMRQGVTSEPLCLGQEQLIRFNDKTGARIFLTKNGLEEDGLFHITGNIDFVVLCPYKEDGIEQELLYVSLRNEFALTYREENGLRKVMDFQVQSLPGSANIEIHEQSYQSEVQTGALLPFNEPQKAALHVLFSDVQWGIGAQYDWQCEMMLDENENVILALKPQEL